MRTVVIVGSSIGGVRTAQALRSEGHDGRVVLVGEEPDLPYDKPPLSKALLGGATDPAALCLLTREAAAEAGIELLLGHRALRLDVAAKTVELENHAPVAYDSVVIATGARARPSPWEAGSGVHVLRTMADSERLRADLLTGGPVVVIGAGFIGSEVASTARLLGCQVTLVDPLSVPMSRVLNPQIGAWFTDLHRRHGVGTVFGVGVEGVDGEQGALRVALTDGQVLAAATVVVGIGAMPNEDWLRSSGLIVDDGVVCDEYCRAVDKPDVFAVGDVARWFHRGYGADMRIEHWTNAVDQAVCVAHNITKPDDLRSYASIGYVWSDQYDWKVQVAGRTGGISAHVVIGEPGVDERLAALYSEDGAHLCGAAIVNWPRALVECRRALKAAALLADVETTLVAAHRAAAAADRVKAPR